VEGESDMKLRQNTLKSAGTFGYGPKNNTLGQNFLPLNFWGIDR
jgi:hypothetical protein